MKKVLVLCTGNSCRSQMVEGYIRHFAGDKARVYSAGIETPGVNPKAIKVMKEDGVDISKHTCNQVDEYANIDFNYIITVCANAAKNSPSFSPEATQIHFNFPDPARAIGTNRQILEAFRRTRNMMKGFSQDFINQYIS